MDSLAPREADRMAQRFAYDACREKHGHLIRAAQYLQWAAESLKDAGLPEYREGTTDLHDVLATSLDALSNTHGLIINEADAEKIAPEIFPLDVSDLEAMYAELKRA
jgi:hypothetical protein